MPHISKKKTPEFKSEADEGAWYASPAGQRATDREFRRAIRAGTVKVHPNGANVKPTDPAVLQAVMERARTSMTQAVSLRIPTADLDAAKRIAVKKGVGYQTVLKEAIREGLRRA